MSLSKAQVRADQRLRRDVLAMVKHSQHTTPSGRLSGRWIFDELADRLDDEQHLMRLLRELVTKELIEERDRRKFKNDRFGLDHLDYAITDKGQRLLAGHEPVDLDIDDERRGPDEED